MSGPKRTAKAVQRVVRRASGNGASATPRRVPALVTPRSSSQDSGTSGHDTNTATENMDAATVEREPLTPPPAYPSPLSTSTISFATWGNRLTPLWTHVRSLSVETWLWMGVLVLATILRFWGLGDKPLHHDESMHAYFSLALAKAPSSYQYDPLLHGPFQFHAEGLMFSIILTLQHIFASRSIGDPWINDTTTRFVPALFGIAIVALPFWLRRELGRAGALIAAFLLAVSPAFVYFSRFLREDVYFNFFMFAMVVCAVRYARTRSTGWFVAMVAAGVLAYTTFEGIFLTLVIFFGFLGLLLVWELAGGLSHFLPASFTGAQRAFFARAGLLALAGALAGMVALVGLRQLNAIAAQIAKNPAQTDAQVLTLENNSVTVVLWVSIFIALLVIASLLWQMIVDDRMMAAAAAQSDMDRDESLTAPALSPTLMRLDAIVRTPLRWLNALRDRVDPDGQPLLRLLLTINWVQWFVAFVTGWLIFAVLFWIVPGQTVKTFSEGFQRGIGLGMWQGLYYWLQQQHVARGGQPWYYYLLVIPLYEQLAVVFGLAGLVYTLIRPTRFRLFLVWWFLGSLVLYSWASEKMPWLTIHILLPLMLLAAIMLQVVLMAFADVLQRLTRREPLGETALLPLTGLAAVRPWLRPAGTLATGLLALFLLVPMISGMLILSQRNAADAPHEMLVYVQTTTDVSRIMDYIANLDHQRYGGRHQISIGVGPGQEWPFYWYLRDYPNARFQYQAGLKDTSPVDIMILDPGGQANGADAQGFLALHPSGFKSQQYRLRAWWDEAYKPAPPAHPDAESQFIVYGVGVGNYLTYGSLPPKDAHFDLGKATGRVWSWLWTRAPLGDIRGSTDFVAIVSSSMPGLPTPTPLQR